MFIFYSFCLLIFYSSSIQSTRLTEEIFYKADKLLYTPEFCSSLKAVDFVYSIRPIPSRTRDAKTKAFKTLFEACRSKLLYDANMAKHVIVPMVDTKNSEYLPLLLDQGMIKESESLKKYPGEMKEVYNNIDLSPEIKSIVFHLFGINLSPSPTTLHYFFQVRHPDLALAYILAYSKVGKEDIGEIRDMMENIKEHVGLGEYADDICVKSAIGLLDWYFMNPNRIGNHKVNLSILNIPKTIEDEDEGESNLSLSLSLSSSSSILKGFGFVLGCGLIFGVLMVIWRNQANKVAYHRQS